jgi:D-beta-D-heptose 7-phosphate kinase/D-beta-D-heptose 1-phosphate adenosyltransferase
MDAISKFLARNQEKKVKIAVVGDALLDEYYDVDASRVSPEFPIPVMRSVSGKPDRVVPGGAANVCYQFRNFNVDAELLCILDAEAAKIFKDYGIHFDYSELPYAVSVPRKRRYYQGQFPLCRWDIENDRYGLPLECLKNIQKLLRNNVKQYLKDSDVVIFSDYHKGVFIDDDRSLWFENRDLVTIVDPKQSPIETWAECTVFKPNAKEAITLSGGLTDWQQQCDFFQKTLNCYSVVITQGGDGVMGKVDGKYFMHFGRRKDAKSVIGAGDCFLAFLAMGLAHKMDLVEAVELAYEAGAIYIENTHNTPVKPEQFDPISVKFVTPEQLKNRDYRLVMTNGCFDFGLTAAHVRYLEQAKALGDKLVVALNSDASTRRLKGDNRPIMPLAERMEVVAGLGVVDFVTSFDEDTPINLIKKMMPDLLVKGGDYKVEEVVGYGIVPVAIVDKFDRTTTTEKLAKFRDDQKQCR